MTKKQIIILISVFFIILGGIIFVFIVVPNINSNQLEVGKYKLKYGLYEGYETEYDQENQEVIKNKKEIILIDDESFKMNDKVYPFTVKENKLYVYGNEYFEVTDNNKLTLLLGGGIDYEWKRKNK